MHSTIKISIKGTSQSLTLKAPFKNAPDDTFCDIFPKFCQIILLKYYALFNFFEKKQQNLKFSSANHRWRVMG